MTMSKYGNKEIESSESNSNISEIYTSENNTTTTGNNYGIYDMASGNSEYVAAYINHQNSENELVLADGKYKDIYNDGQLNFGDALKNNIDYSSSLYFFVRGGYTLNNSIFNTNQSNGNASVGYSYRNCIYIYSN